MIEKVSILDYHNIYTTLTKDLSPGIAFPYCVKLFKAERNARAQISVQFLFVGEINCVLILVKNRQYNAPDAPPISSSAICANSRNVDAGCENCNLSIFNKAPEK